MTTCNKSINSNKIRSRQLVICCPRNVLLNQINGTTNNGKKQKMNDNGGACWEYEALVSCKKLNCSGNMYIATTQSTPATFATNVQNSLIINFLCVIFCFLQFATIQVMLNLISLSSSKILILWDTGTISLVKLCVRARLIVLPYSFSMCLKRLDL